MLSIGHCGLLFEAGIFFDKPNTAKNAFAVYSLKQAFFAINLMPQKTPLWFTLTRLKRAALWQL